MTMREREGLIARIRHIRRAAPAPDPQGKGSAGDLEDSQLRTLEARVGHLERLVEGLQDSVYRESERQSRLLAELRAQIQPGAMSAALAKDARNRGL
jgi:hypothetical protein